MPVHFVVVRRCDRVLPRLLRQVLVGSCKEIFLRIVAEDAAWGTVINFKAWLWPCCRDGGRHEDCVHNVIARYHHIYDIIIGQVSICDTHAEGEDDGTARSYGVSPARERILLSG